MSAVVAEGSGFLATVVSPRMMVREPFKTAKIEMALRVNASISGERGIVVETENWSDPVKT